MNIIYVDIESNKSTLHVQKERYFYGEKSRERIYTYISAYIQEDSYNTQ